MPRRKWVQTKDGLVEVDPHTYKPKGADTFKNIIPDIQPFETIDGDVIGGKRQLRDHERDTGTRQVGNDFKKPVDHDTAVRQTREKLIQHHKEQGVPLRFARADWQHPGEGFDG